MSKSSLYYCSFSVVVIFLSFFSISTRAAAPAVELKNIETKTKNLEYDDVQIKQKSRMKLYPGGRDEEALKVQPQIQQATRKMGPASEAPELTPGAPAED